MKNTTLPVHAFRDRILTSVANGPVTIVTAETGAGKSTQVPQYLMAAGYEVIVTQPRRLAARSLAERVAEEHGTKLGDVVGYMTAHEKSFSERTQCLFVTDGLQMVNELVGRRSTNGRILVLDEVHEWNLNVEVLVAWARKQAEENPTFKVVLMSATLEAERLAEYFNNAPVIHVPGRTFPITRQDPGISIAEDVERLVQERRNILVFQPGKAEIEDTIFQLNQRQLGAIVLPLHGELDTADQKRCFQHYHLPKVIVSTNVAQTSVTIDDIDAVIDSGMERRVELVDGVEGLYLKSISLSDSKQRAGRAGRTKEGIYIDHCGSFDRLQFPKAEIERVRLDQTVLRLAEVGFDMENLTFFHQPDREKILRAKSDLKKLGCIDEKGKVTTIGRKVARLPISVAFGRMVIEADRLGVVKDAITIAAILEIGQLNARKDSRGGENMDWRFHIDRETDSDLVAQLNLFKKAELMDRDQMKDAGIHVGAFYRVKESRRNLERALQRVVSNTESEGPKENILKAICAGMVNHLFRREYGMYRGDDGVLRELGRESVMRSNSEFVVGLPFDLEIPQRFGKKTLRLLRMATKVDFEMLAEVAPQLVSVTKGHSPRYSLLEDSIMSTTKTMFNGTVIKEVEELDPDHPDAVEVKVNYLYEHGDRPFHRHLSLLTPDVTVPELREHIVGKHPVTGEDLVIYATYEMSMYGSNGSPIWLRDKEEALQKRRDFIDGLAARFYRSREYFEPTERAVEVVKVREELKPPPTNAIASSDKLASLAARFAKPQQSR